MGNFYTNITLRGPTQQSVAAYLEGARLSAFVSPVSQGGLVVYDELSTTQDQEILSGLAGRLSRSLDCPALAVMNHDDDFLFCWVYESGRLTEEYRSGGGLLSGLSRRLFGGPPLGKELCRVFGCAFPKEIGDILGGAYLFAVDRHKALAKALGIPEIAVGIGFDDILRDAAGFLGPEQSERFVRTKGV